MIKQTLSKLFLIILIFTPFEVKAAEEFIDLQCLSDIKTKYPCNVSFYRKFMKLNYPRSGRSNKVRYENIMHWNYSDSSLRKRDMELASRIGIIGLLFTKVEHQHVFTIVYRDEYGDRKVAILDFDNKEFVLPIKSALSDLTEIKWENTYEIYLF